jgi:hypothetical protein
MRGQVLEYGAQTQGHIEPELIQTHMVQKTLLWVKGGLLNFLCYRKKQL